LAGGAGKGLQILHIPYEVKLRILTG